jgi:cytochrome o ubiquinol oxidase operon protein cyoD
MNTHSYFEKIGAWSHTGASSLQSYVIGGILSLALTLSAYLLVVYTLLPGDWLVFALLALALLQFLIQIRYFLHLGRGIESRAQILALGSIILIVLVLVVGSRWIMSTLNQRMMLDPGQMEEYMNRQPGL